MKWVCGFIVALLAGLGIWIAGQDEPEERDASSDAGQSERTLVDQRERQVARLKGKSSRVLTAEDAQEKIEDFLGSNEDLRHWDQETVGEFNQLVYFWGVADPKGAMSYIGNLNGPADLTLRDRMTVQVMRAWGYLDGAAALAWFHEPGQKREKDSTALVNLLQGMHQADAGAVDRFLVTLPESDKLVNQTYIKRIARLKLNRNLEKATRWAKEFPIEYVREIAMDQIAEDLGSRDPVAAAGWIEKHASDPSADSAVVTVVSSWKRQDSVNPEEIANWTKGLSPGEGRATAMAMAVANWAKVEPGEAAGFVNDLGPGAERQKVIAKFAPAIASADPGSAIEWASKINDQEVRNHTMIRSLVRWAIVDREAAVNWMESANVDQAVREAISVSPYFGNRREE